MQRRIIAIINQKGGVGKTTTAINLGAYLAQAGKTVLLVDFDPQGNATSGLGVSKNEQKLTTYEVLLNPASLADAILQTGQEKLYLLPANANLAAAEVELVNEPGREHKLHAALALAQYDYVLVDCPPALGLLTINALAATDLVLIPVQAEYYAIEGLSQLLNIVQRVRESVNPELVLLGVVLTMYDKRTSLAEQVEAEMQKHFGDTLFNTVIPRNVRLAEAPSYGRSIAAHDRWSKGARAYKQLASEVIKKIEG